MMSALIQRAVTVVLILVTIATNSWELPVCHLPSCFCNKLTHNISDTERHDSDDVTPTVSSTRHHHDTYDVTCFVKSFSSSDQTMQRLTSEVRSVKLFCSDFYSQNLLTSATFRQIPNLLKLGLENCHFSTVSEHVFDSVPELQVLEIENCLFTELPRNVFKKTVDLSRLSMSQCGLQTLPQLCSLHNLQQLNVSGQSLSSLDQSLEECGLDMLFHNLTTLDISNNSFLNLPQNFLDKVPRLRELHVQNNQISEISLRGNAELEMLDVSGQELKKIDLIRAECVSQLKVLKLQGNGSRLFPNNNLKCMPNLTFLHLQNLAIDDSFWEALPFLKILQRLALPVNQLTGINLTDTVSLTHLNLSRNAITELKRSTFMFQRDLVDIDLSWNNVTKVTSSCFLNMTSLQTLNLQHNQLVMILQTGFQHLPSLQNLLLDNNQLRSLPSYLLRQMKALKILTVSHNKLTFLPFLVDAQELLLVSANYNRIISLSHTPFSGLPNLEYLFLRGNNLTALDPALFRKAPILGYLDLSENQIVRVQPFGNHRGLKWIRLDHNKIQDMTFVVRDLSDLRVLFLDDNHMTRLTSKTFPPSLQTLSLSWNLLTYVEPYLFTTLPNLVAVNLGANFNLYSLSHASVQISPTNLPKPAFTVAPNLFVCDCHLAYLKAWDLTTGTVTSDLLATLPDFLKLQELGCVTHFTGADRPKFKDVPLSYFVCSFQEALCDETCPCCQTQSPVYDPNCTCILTCPDACTCYHGGSEYLQLYTHVWCQARNLTSIPDRIPARATHVRLDGNDLSVFRNTSLNHVTSIMFLYLNNSWIESLEPGCFHGLGALRMLDLSHNNLIRLDEATFGLLPALEELDLQNNQIQFLGHAAFSGLTALKILHLNDNLLKDVDSFSVFPSFLLLTLASNAWSCDCEFVASFLKFLTTQHKNVLDYSSVRCFFDESDSSVSENLSKSDGTLDTANSTFMNKKDFNNQSSVLMSDFQFHLFCTENGSRIRQDSVYHDGSVSQRVLVAIVCVVVVVVVGVGVGVACVLGRAVIQAVLYVRFGIRLWDTATKLDREEDTATLNKNAGHGTAAGVGVPTAQGHQRTYDAFVSYSHHDEDFVVNTLVPRLEQQGPRQYRLCVHYRDFPVGHSIADTIMDSVEKSQRTILLLSRHFLQSDWCRFEFRTAHHHVLLEGGHRLIIILLEELADDLLDGDLKVAMKTRTYLSARDPWFWEKLYFAMPDLPCRHRDNQLQELQPTATHNQETKPVASLYYAELIDDISERRANYLLESLEFVVSTEEMSKLSI